MKAIILHVKMHIQKDELSLFSQETATIHNVHYRVGSYDCINIDEWAFRTHSFRLIQPARRH